jgi:hypothetical protein
MLLSLNQTEMTLHNGKLHVESRQRLIPFINAIQTSDRSDPAFSQASLEHLSGTLSCYFVDSREQACRIDNDPT